jgi:hypothetical protein
MTEPERDSETELSLLERRVLERLAAQDSAAPARFTLEHPGLAAGANAVGFLKNGLIDNLECVTYEGDWPEDEGVFRIVDAAVPH